MSEDYAALEIYRWGFAHLPGAVFYYGKELELSLEDIGFVAALFYAFEHNKPLFQTGIQAGQLMICCPALNTQRISRKLTQLSRMNLIKVKDGKSRSFADKTIFLEPLLERLQQLIIRDHPLNIQDHDKIDVMTLEKYQKKIEQLELELKEEKDRSPAIEPIKDFNENKSASYKIVADFIAKKSGNLLSVKMENELQKWLDDLGFTPEFLLCMLELTFERNINNPREITRIAKDLKEYSVNTVEGLETYFSKYVDANRGSLQTGRFDPDIAEFGVFTGIDMSADARKKMYYKWRYDWRFTHQMIMKAGEIMCQRTKNGGLEYVDSVIHNWMSKEIRSVEEADKEIIEFKKRNKNTKTVVTNAGKSSSASSAQDYEIYVPPEVLEELKTKA
ncbi:MAG TPA: DnaD domain protein [Syntrophomonas sp.]|nr:DnaD domain protein [Syntrophomonas sp.]